MIRFGVLIRCGCWFLLIVAIVLLFCTDCVYVGCFGLVSVVVEAVVVMCCD